jgi:hypothetical protein
MLSPTSLFIPYANLLGYVALAIEATLPLPQLLANYRRKGCKGFRVSVIANWIIGDTFKMWFFFASGSGEGGVPIAFKICGIFQALCDAGLGAQFFIWGDGPEAGMGTGIDGFGREKVGLSPVPEAYEMNTPLEDRRGPFSAGMPTGSDEKVFGVEPRL